MEDHGVSFAKVLRLRVQLSLGSQWKAQVHTQNSRWFVAVERYSPEAAKAFNSQFGFEEFEGARASPGEEAKKVPASQQIVRALALGVSADFDKLLHSNLRLHVHVPPKHVPDTDPEARPESLLEGEQQAPAVEQPGAGHKCLFALTASNLEGNVVGLFKSVPKPSQQDSEAEANGADGADSASQVDTAQRLKVTPRA